MYRYAAGVYLLLLALLLGQCAAGASERASLRLVMPSLDLLSTKEHMVEMATFLDELFRSLQFASLVTKSVQSAPDQFTASVDFSATTSATADGLSVSTTTQYIGSVARDLAWGTWVNGTLASSIAPAAEPVIPQAALVAAAGSFEIRNEICSDIPQQNVTLYSHILDMPMVGEVACPPALGLEGTCQHFAFSANPYSGEAYLYDLDEESDYSVPVYISFSVVQSQGSSTSDEVEIYISDYDVNPGLTQSDFDTPVACDRAFYESCEALADPATIQLYVLAVSSDPLSLSNRQAMDVYAAAASVCSDSFKQEQNETSVHVARFSAVVDRNFDMMNAKNSEGRVQHSGTMFYGDGDFAGQCSENEGIGNWFFFPADGMCGEGETVGDGACFWEQAFNITSVELACFIDSGIQDLCAADFQLPFATAAQLLDTVFDADGTDMACAPVVVDTYPVETSEGDNQNNGDDENPDDDDDDELQDDGWLWLAGILTVACLALIVVVVVLALVAFKFKDRLMDMPIFAILTREPQPSGDYDNSQWKTISEGGSNGLLDGDLMDDDDLDLTFD